jgi:hypothetical protein
MKLFVCFTVIDAELAGTELIVAINVVRFSVSEVIGGDCTLAELLTLIRSALIENFRNVSYGHSPHIVQS